MRRHGRADAGSSLRAAILAGAALAIGASAAPQGAGAPAATRCGALAGLVVPASRIGLATRGATVTSATTQEAEASAGTPSFCKVLGEVRASDAADPAIRFELNLPANWNGKAVQFGGGGFNGTVVTGLGPAPHAPPGAPTPLAIGFATFGGDSGHAGPGGRFGLNDQALANFGGESVKRTHDAAIFVVSRYYGKTPRRTYYVGGSKGGHEALVAAQRYGADYDGVVAYYPANQNQALVLSWYRMWSAVHATPGAALSTGQQALLKARVLAACDRLDGAGDGIVSDPKACGARFGIEALACPAAREPDDTCLSAPQIAALRVAATPLRLAFPLAHDVHAIGPFPVFRAADTSGLLYDRDGFNAYRMFSDDVIRYFIERDPDGATDGFDYRRHRSRIQAISRLYDATDPDLDTFRRRGGKLLLIQGTTDMLVPEAATTAYFEKVRQRYGGAVAGFARYYVQPGFGHAGGDFTMSWDSLGALDDWVERGRSPLHPVAVDVAPATRGRSRPLCEYPLFPRYRGSGSLNEADSFVCARH